MLGNCKLVDPKQEKNGNYEVMLGREEKHNYFTCDNPKGVVSSAREEVVVFRFTPPKMDPFIADIEAFHHFGQWV